MSDSEDASPPSTQRQKLSRRISQIRLQAREETATDDNRAYAEWIKALLATQLESAQRQEDGHGHGKGKGDRKDLTTYYMHQDLDLLQDLRNGSLLILLTEAVTGESLVYSLVKHLTCLSEVFLTI
jgi:hypothetical protein